MDSETVRKRIPRKPSQSDDPVLDEQEQEAVIQQFKAESSASTSQYMNFLRAFLTLSFVVHMFSLVKNPFLVAFPPTTPDRTEIPLPIPFTLINLALHLNLGVIVFRDHLRTRYNKSEIELQQPLPWQVAYAAAAVPPLLSMYLRQSWQATSWWGFTALMVFMVHTVTSSVDAGNKSISELESLRYNIRGV